MFDVPATLEASSVSFERDGTPSLGIVTALTADGRRALANTRDVDTLTALSTDAREGSAVRITTDGAANTVHLT